MSKLTIDALQQRNPAVTLYLIEADRCHYAFLANSDMSEDRLHDLFLGCPEEGFTQYFDSPWYPLTYADTQLESIGKLEEKVRSVRCADIDKYITVLLSHGDSINDNFSTPLPATLDEAMADVEKIQKFFQG